VRFEARAGGAPLRCGTAYPGLGTGGAPVELRDFRAYVRGVTLVRANGERHPLQLTEDGTWQREGLALLDFADGTGGCAGGTPEVHTEVAGRAPPFDDYTGLEFTLGVPPEKNHLDAAKAAAPLNTPGMFWSWKGGYRYVRLDVGAPGTSRAFVFHLGAEGCQGDPASGYRCEGDNQAPVSLQGFHPDRQRVVLDVASFYAGVDLSREPDGVSDAVAGCMSDGDDPECAPLMRHFGLGPSAASTRPGAPDAFIRVE
jgi:uncharacterized repeat protein (TIGR04052 family)